jgi:hypothetical protein
MRTAFPVQAGSLCYCNLTQIPKFELVLVVVLDEVGTRYNNPKTVRPSLKCTSDFSIASRRACITVIPSKADSATTPIIAPRAQNKKRKNQIIL